MKGTRPVTQAKEGFSRFLRTYLVTQYTASELEALASKFGGVSMTQIMELSVTLFKNTVLNQSQYDTILGLYEQAANAHEDEINPDRHIIDLNHLSRSERQKFTNYSVKIRDIIANKLVEYVGVKRLIGTSLNKKWKDNQTAPNFDFELDESWEDAYMEFTIPAFIKLARICSKVPCESTDDIIHVNPGIMREEVGYPGQKTLVQSNYVHLTFFDGMSIDQFRGMFANYSWLLVNDFGRGEESPNNFHVYMFLTKPIESIAVHNAIVDQLVEKLGEHSGLVERLARDPAKSRPLPCINVLHREHDVFITNCHTFHELSTHTIDVDKFDTGFNVFDSAGNRVGDGS